MSAQLKDLTRLHQPSPARSGMVKISYGVHNLEAAIAGKSVSEVRQSLKEPLNIDPRALALVNGRDVAASYILNQGDQLEFVRLAGEKGGTAWRGLDLNRGRGAILTISEAESHNRGRAVLTSFFDMHPQKR
jgi:hypothetical protein